MVATPKLQHATDNDEQPAEAADTGADTGVDAEAAEAPALPDWAAEALVAAGMTRAEVDAYAAERAGLDDDAVDARAEAVEATVQAMEDAYLDADALTLADLADLAELAEARLARTLTTDRNNVFFDHDNPRMLAVVRRLAAGLRAFDDSGRLQLH